MLNLSVLAGLALSAWSFAQLAREFIDDRAVVWIAGLLFAASPFVLYEAVEVRPTQAILALPPLVLRTPGAPAGGPGSRRRSWAAY